MRQHLAAHKCQQTDQVWPAIPLDLEHARTVARPNQARRWDSRNLGGKMCQGLILEIE